MHSLRLCANHESWLDRYFSVPLQIARRKLTGMRDSLVTSSVWRTEFKKPLETFPEFETVRMDFAVPACDACHLGGRVSTLTGRVSGDPYDRLTFEVGSMRPGRYPLIRPWLANIGKRQ